MKNRALPEDYKPSTKDVEWFLNYWNNNHNYSNHSQALKKLFQNICKYNTCIEDVIIKCSTLNDFYSTNIYDISTMAEHILSLNIDQRLEQHDYSLVKDIAQVKIGGKRYYFYSFATKYCSHHQPDHYAIYDSYVEKVLLALNLRDAFACFKHKDLKKYETFMNVIKSFQQHYDLMQYNIKELDQYLWQLGKWYFNPYGLSFKYYNREEENPFPHNDVRNHFWHGEMMFVTTGQNVSYWKESGREQLNLKNEIIQKLARKYSPEQLGVIIYIAAIFRERCPYEDQSWLIEY